MLDFLLHLQAERKLAPATLNQAVCALRTFYRDHLRKTWKIWAKISIRREEPLPHVLTRAEVAKLLGTFRDGRYRAYFTLTYQCGLRMSEALHIRPKELYGAILQQSAQALRDITATKTGGGLAGFTSVLHTWGRQLQHHPHVHCIVPALAWQPERKHPIHPKDETFLVHYAPLAERFRNLMRLALQSEHPEIFANLPLSAKQTFLPAKTWNVQLQHVGRGHTAVRYLARYVKRSAIGPHRLIGYDKHGNIRLHWTSSETGKPGILTLTPHEFIRRWLIHVLPKGFARVRHYGFMSAAATRTLQSIRLHLGADPKPEPVLPEPKPHTCPCCGGTLTFLREIAPIRALRAPPKRKTTHAA